MTIIRELENRTELEMTGRRDPGVFRSHWQIFVPTMIIVAGYGAGLGYLWLTDESDSALFRLFAIILAVGTPLLATHAFLRYQTVRLRIKPHRLLYHPGWPKDTPVEIPNELIARLYVKYGLGGGLLRSGTLVIETVAGGRVAIADLREPEKAVEAFNANR